MFRKLPEIEKVKIPAKSRFSFNFRKNPEKMYRFLAVIETIEGK